MGYVWNMQPAKLMTTDERTADDRYPIIVVGPAQTDPHPCTALVVFNATMNDEQLSIDERDDTIVNLYRIPASHPEPTIITYKPNRRRRRRRSIGDDNRKGPHRRLLEAFAPLAAFAAGSACT